VGIGSTQISEPGRQRRPGKTGKQADAEKTEKQEKDPADTVHATFAPGCIHFPSLGLKLPDIRVRKLTPL
jgi:hypothetical protein